MIISVLVLIALFFGLMISTTNATDKSIDTTESYVMIGGISIISNDVVQDFSIEGVTYNEAKNVLTLNNFTGTSIYIQNKTISIEILGTNLLKPENGTAFQTNNNIDTTITFTGTGTLNMISNEKDCEVVASYGGNGSANLIIDGPSINVTGYNYAIHGLGIEVRKGMLVAKCTDGISVPIQDSALLKYSDNMQYIDNGNILIIKEHEIVTKTDTKTNIKLNTTTDVIPDTIQLVAEEVKSGDSYNTVVKAIGNDVEKFVLYDISLINNNAKIQPNGKVKISIPVPEGYNTSKIVVYRIAEDGTKTKYDTIIDNGYITFETDHFSNYVVAEEKTKAVETPISSIADNKEPNTSNESKLDNEPKTGEVAIKLFIGIGLVAFVILIVNNKKKNTEI